MIVQRITYLAKPGNRDEMLELLQEMWEMNPRELTHRIYVPTTGPRDAIQQEIEFEDHASREEFWEKSLSDPKFAPYLKKWRELRDTGGTTEFLGLVE